jgi:hypothetical protein
MHQSRLLLAHSYHTRGGKTTQPGAAVRSTLDLGVAVSLCHCPTGWRSFAYSVHRSLLLADCQIRQKCCGSGTASRCDLLILGGNNYRGFVIRDEAARGSDPGVALETKSGQELPHRRRLWYHDPMSKRGDVPIRTNPHSLSCADQCPRKAPFLLGADHHPRSLLTPGGPSLLHAHQSPGRVA